ncbi:MAG TPA: J domain-containing protein [Polyangiaceae bacterium]|nr:J domain-containing protein [Polyangiaceae bacterium]
MPKETKLYKALGVAPTASADEIKRAYRKLAAKHHPDKRGGNEERFKEIATAYEVLGDPDKRKLYDEFGEVALSSGFDADKARAYAAASTPFESGFEGGGVNLEDLLRGMSGFGGGPFDGVPFSGDPRSSFSGFGGGRRRGRSGLAGEDLHATVELDLASAIRGTRVELEVPREEACRSCKGTGEVASSNEATCAECDGSGRRQVNRGNVRMVATCTRCGGAGRVVTPCGSCGGVGQKRRRRKLTVRIPPGADDGSTIRLKGKGRPGVGGGPPGDLIIETKVKPHPLIRRDGLDLTMKVPVTLEEAYLGAEIDVPTFAGNVKLRVPPGSQNGTKLRMRGKGVARGKKRGDFYVELDVRMPPAGDPSLEKALRGTNRVYDRPVRAGLSL